MKAAMKCDQRDGKKREPDMGLQPHLNTAQGQRLFAATPTEQGRENKNEQGRRAVDQAERSGADIPA